MATKKTPSLSVGRGEKLPVSKGAGLTAKGRAKYNAATGLKYYVENDNVTLYRESSNAYAEITLSTLNSVTVNLTQDGIAIKQMVNSAGTTTINIKQSQ